MLNCFSDGFESEQVVVTSVALERKYMLDGIIDKCNEILDTIEGYHDYFFPYAQHGALLYSVLQRINLLSPKTYQFSIEIIFSLFDEILPLNNPKSSEEKDLWKDIEDKQYPQLPLLIETNELKKEDLSPPDSKQIDGNLKKMIQSFIQIILPQLSNEHRLEFLVLLQFLLKTAIETTDGKNEILQLEFLATGLPRIDTQSLAFPSTLSQKPQWIESDLLWFDIVSLKNLFNEDDLLHHLSDFILKNDQLWKTWYQTPQLSLLPNPNGQQYSQLEKLLIIRLLRPEYLVPSLREYVIEQFDLNNLQTKDIDFKGVNIISLPSIPVKSRIPGEFLVNQIDFDYYLQDLLKTKGKQIRQIDCQFVNQIYDLNENTDLIYLKNVHQSSFASLIKQIRREGRHDVVVSKEANVNFICLGARLHHYDCLIEGKVTLGNLLYRNSTNYLREIIGQLISSSSSILRQCQSEQLTIIYGTILIQSILVYYEQMFDESFFTLQWTRNLPEFIFHLLENNNKDKKSLLEELLPMSYPSHSPFLRQLLNEFIQQSSSKTSLKFFDCQFEIPQNENQFNLQWFLSKHSKLDLNFNDYPARDKCLQHQFDTFQEQLNQLWHDKYPHTLQMFNISFIYDQIHLLKERLPPKLNLSSLTDFKQDLISIAFYQEMIYFNKQMETIFKDMNEMEEMSSYGSLLIEKTIKYRSIAFDLQRNRIPSQWFANQSSASKSLSIIQFIHQCRHRFNEYYSWINSLNEVEKIDCHCISRCHHLIDLMSLSQALQLNVTQDKIRCIGQWALTKEKKFSSQNRHLIFNNLTIINGIVENNNRIKSISGTTNVCPSIEIFAIESQIDGYQCPVYSTPSSRLDPPLFYLIINEQIDPMTYIVLQNDKEDVSRIPFPTVIGQEQQKPLLNKNELVPFREMSPVSQLSQSTDRTNTPPGKDIRRDEPMLGFE